MDTPRAKLIARIRSLLRDECPPPVVSLALGGSGAISDATVKVRASCLTEFGETKASPTVSVAVGGTPRAVILTVARVPAARAYRIYASIEPEAERFFTDLRAFAEPTASVTFTSPPLPSGPLPPEADEGTLYASARGYEAALDLGVAHYSRLWPRELEAQLEGGSSVYPFPEGWEAGFSSVLAVRDDPAGGGPPRMLPLPRIVGDRLVFPHALRGENLKLRFTSLHRVAADASTIPGRHEEAVALLAASYVCLEVASRYAHTGARTIGADTVQYEDRPRLFGDAPDTEAGWSGLAKQFRQAAYRALGASPEGTRPTLCVAEWLASTDDGGRPC